MYQAIVFLPLVGFLIAGLFGRFIGARASEVITTSLLFSSAVLSWIAFFQVGFGIETLQVPLARWISSGELVVDWALRIDTLTAIMLVVINSISAFVHLYSIGYMHEDPARPRFFAYLSLFTFAMLMLVTADNLVQMFFGWEGVGLASYLLIGFWYEKPSACAAAMKAFIVNRVGDFGFMLGLILTFVLFGSVGFVDIFSRTADFKDASFHFIGFEWHALTLVALLLFVGAMGKSAQFLLHTWLPDAMEGPTPVSALIHAATMVTAGVFMVSRMSPVFECAPAASSVIIIVGGMTAFFAATVGLVQNDIKRVIAYSTCSQLGYMFVALGVGAYSVGVFHLFTHACFKALLFLGAGSVIHAMHHEQDMRKMGGLRKHIPFTAAAMIIGTLALTGFPFTAGYFSKDAIIESAYVSASAGGTFAFISTVLAAFMTSFYSWRLYFMTFEGKPRWEHGPHGDENHSHEHVPHESPGVMRLPLAVLSVGSLFAGVAFVSYFIGENYDFFWKGALFTAEENHILHEIHEVPLWVQLSPLVMMIAGFLLALWFYVLDPAKPHQLASSHSLLYRFFLNKWYVDELYDFLFVRSAKWLGKFFWKQGDGWLIDKHGPDGISARVLDITDRIVRIQTGYVYHYAFAMLIGVVIFMTWYVLGGTI